MGRSRRSPVRRWQAASAGGTLVALRDSLRGQKEPNMTDDKSKRGERDRSRVAAGEDFEVEYFARQAGITPEQARTLIRRHGNDRAKLMEEARLIKGES